MVGAARIVLELIKEDLDPNSFLYTIGNVNFLTFGAWFFLFCVILVTVVSWISAVPAIEKVRGFTFQTISSEDQVTNKASYNWKDIVVSIAVVAAVAWVMIIFNGR